MLEIQQEKIMHYPSKKRRRLIRGLYTNDMDCSCNENATIRHAYNCWHRMIERCHNPKYQETCSTYIGCSICDEWKNFSNFFEWYKVNYKDGCELDKDILVKGNKVYSPETCCFVPQEINKILLKGQKKRGYPCCYLQLYAQHLRGLPSGYAV